MGFESRDEGLTAASVGLRRLIAICRESLRLLKLLQGLGLALCALGASAQDAVELPEIGDSAGAILTPEQDRELGERIMREILRLELKLNDPLTDAYISQLGFRLVAQSDQPERRFNFFVFNSPDLNAFATFGGNIAVNAGLILRVPDENELAGVMAHEAAHVTQNHLARSIESASKVQPLVMLAMVGAILAGGGEAAEAAIVGGQALMQQSQINFTRSNEFEADRVGIQTLARAGFNPIGMAGVFGRFQRAYRIVGPYAPPEYLRTHPVNATRIAEAKNRALAMKVDPRPTDPMYPLIRERVRNLIEDDTRRLLAFYDRADTTGDEIEPTARRYGRALALARANRFDEALATFRALQRDDAPRLIYRLAEAEALVDAGQREVGLTLFGELLSLNQRSRPVSLSYARALLSGRTVTDGRRAEDVMKALLLTSADDAEVQELYSQAAALSGDESRALEAKAEVYYLRGNAFDAINQLEALAKRSDLEYYQRARIEARIEQLAPIVLEERGRMVPGQPQQGAVSAG
jgi:beta-barrel assembly-enhancing protease